MAQEDMTTDDPLQATRGQITRDLRLLEMGLHTLHSTAICVQFALLHQDAEFDREIASYVPWTISLIHWSTSASALRN